MLCAAAGVTATVVLAAGRRLPVTDDEVWFLQVVNRCRTGEVLYRDVFYGAGPLAVWVALAVVRATRPQLLAMRVLSVAYFVALLVAGTWVLGAVGAPGWTPAVLWAGSVAFAGPTWGVDNHYGQLSFLAAAVALGATAALGDGGPRYLALIAGVAAAGALVAKQSVGAVAALATAAIMGATPSTRGGLPLYGVGLTLGLAACLAPVVRAGALADLGRRVFGNKVTYVASGWLAPRDGLRAALATGAGGGALAAPGRVVAATSFLVLPLLVVAVLVDLVVLASGRPEAHLDAGIAMAAAGVALAGAVPRADLPHVQGLLPTGLLAALVTIGAADAGRVWWPPLPPLVLPLVAVAAVWTLVALVVSLDTVHRVPVPGAHADYDLPHLRGLPVQRWLPGTGPRQVHELRAVTGGSVFLLRPDAACWYLAAGLTNPTPYDYPYASVFGPHGQAQTIAAIRRGDIAWVCLPAPMEGRLAPAELQTFVQQSMEPVSETPAGILYRLPAGAGA